MQYWNPILKLNIETNFGFKIFLDQKLFDIDSFVPNIFGTNFWTTTTTTTPIKMGFDIIEIDLVLVVVS